MPSLRPRTAFPLTLAMASLLAGPALLSAHAEPIANPGRSRAPVSHGEVSHQAGTLDTSGGRSKAPVSLQGDEAELGIQTGNSRSRAPIATP